MKQNISKRICLGNNYSTCEIYEYCKNVCNSDPANIEMGRHGTNLKHLTHIRGASFHLFEPVDIHIPILRVWLTRIFRHTLAPEHSTATSCRSGTSNNNSQVVMEHFITNTSKFGCMRFSSQCSFHRQMYTGSSDGTNTRIDRRDSSRQRRT